MNQTESRFTNVNHDLPVRQKCELAKHLENIGHYEEARLVLGDLWQNVGERPSVENLEPAAKAELLLRVGSLSGWIGSAHQIPHAQDIAKDLIAESARIFASLGLNEKAVEAQTDLAICYWRAGALHEAGIWLQEAFSRVTTVENRVRIIINQAIVEIFSNRNDEALKLLSHASPLLEQIQDHAVHGRYHMQRAIAFKRLGGLENLDRALIDNAAASFHLEQARHTRYLARVENNTGLILVEFKRHDEALEHLNRACEIFLELKDSGSVAQVNETRARLFIAQERYDKAEQAATAAVAILEPGGEQSLLAEALTTHGIALAYMGEYQRSFAAFTRAAQTAEAAGDDISSAGTRLLMLEHLRSYLNLNDLFSAYLEADERISRTADADMIERLRAASRLAIEAALRALVSPRDVVMSGSLKEDVRRYEGELIKRALEKTEGQVTNAARMLGMSHQGLCEILNSRHKNLRHRPPRLRRSSHSQTVTS